MVLINYLCENRDILLKLNNYLNKCKGDSLAWVCLKDICNLKDGDWEFPTRAQLEKKKIIVCTLITAGR